jgi:hypothetical protein
MQFSIRDSHLLIDQFSNLRMIFNHWAYARISLVVRFFINSPYMQATHARILITLRDNMCVTDKYQGAVAAAARVAGRLSGSLLDQTSGLESGGKNLTGARKARIRSCRGIQIVQPNSRSAVLAHVWRMARLKVIWCVRLSDSGICFKLSS